MRAIELPAYVDESYRQGGRYLLAVVIADGQVGAARQALRAQARAFKKLIHFNELTPAQRATAMSKMLLLMAFDRLFSSDGWQEGRVRWMLGRWF